VHLSCIKLRDPATRFLSAIYFEMLILLSKNREKISAMLKNNERKVLNLKHKIMGLNPVFCKPSAICFPVG